MKTAPKRLFRSGIIGVQNDSEKEVSVSKFYQPIVHRFHLRKGFRAAGSLLLSSTELIDGALRGRQFMLITTNRHRSPHPCAVELEFQLLFSIPEGSDVGFFRIFSGVERFFSLTMSPLI